jgi:biotin transport system substrate-specific component
VTTDALQRSPLLTAFGVAAFIGGTAAGASISFSVPWTPVPFTLQLLFVFLAGAMLGPWAGGGALAGYVALGALGLPVFAGGNGGVEWLMGPTGGYLIVYPASAFVVGLVVGEARSLRRDAVAVAAGLAVIYAGGMAQLWLLTGVGVARLLELAVLPFWTGDFVKAGAAFGLLRLARVVMQRLEPAPLERAAS